MKRIITRSTIIFIVSLIFISIIVLYFYQLPKDYSKTHPAIILHEKNNEYHVIARTQVKFDFSVRKVFGKTLFRGFVLDIDYFDEVGLDNAYDYNYSRLEKTTDGYYIFSKFCYTYDKPKEQSASYTMILDPNLSFWAIRWNWLNDDKYSKEKDTLYIVAPASSLEEAKTIMDGVSINFD